MEAKLKFAANPDMMFKEYEYLHERMKQIKLNGFRAVELTRPYNETKETLAKCLDENGLQCVLINSWPGNGDGGYAAKPDKVDIFKEKLEISIEYAKAVKCSRMHVLAGCKSFESTEKEARDTFLKNISYAADRLAQENIELLLESVNAIVTVPHYFLDTPDKALEILKEINKPNIKLQIDMYHLQIIKGNLTINLKKFLPYTGYMQISQVPLRNEPGFPGEINYDYIFSLLKELNYPGWIGTEYNPSGNTVDGLQWLSKYLH